jgi:hypothetical protein
MVMAEGRDGIHAGYEVWAPTTEIQFDHFLEVSENVHINCEVRLQITVHLTLHVVNLARGEHTMDDSGPYSVGEGAVTGDLDSDYEGGDE